MAHPAIAGRKGMHPVISVVMKAMRTIFLISTYRTLSEVCEPSRFDLSNVIVYMQGFHFDPMTTGAKPKLDPDLTSYRTEKATDDTSK